jgi:Domain of unknown function (DUF5615)
VKPRFQADNDLDRSIVDGLLRVEPTVDFRTAQDVPLDGLDDDVVLKLAAASGRILVTHDASSMPVAFARFRQTGHSSGVLITPQRGPVAAAIENLLLIWHASDGSEWENRICYLPTLADFLS